MSSGWRYTLRIPSWSQVQLAGETVVFFQVEVTVLPPDDGPPRKRSVGRRYSNFVTLYQRLREEVGQRALAGLEPPPKRSLSAVNKKPELIEKRRWELEQWLWRLTEVPAIANSAMMFHFAELDAASRLISRSRASMSPAASGMPPPEHPSGGGPSYAPSWSGSELSDHLESGEGSEAAAASVAAAAAADVAASRRGSGRGERHASSSHHPRHSPLPPPRDAGHLNRSPSGSTASAESAGAGALAPSLAATSALSPTASASGELLAGLGGRVRLGLHVEQRAAIRGLARTLRDQLKTAAGDLQDAVREIQSDQGAIAQLAAQAQALQEDLDASRAGWEGSPEQQRAAAEVQQAREEGAARAQELERERARAEGLAAQLAAAQGQAAAQEGALQRERAQREELLSQLEALRQQQAEQAERAAAAPGQAAEAAAAEVEAAAQAAAEAEARLAELGQQLEEQSAAAAALRQQLEAQQAEREALVARAVAAGEEVARAAADREAAASKSRADLKVLAREVKGLRQQLAAEQQRSAELAAQLAAAPAVPPAPAPTAAPAAPAAANGTAPAGASGAMPAAAVAGVLSEVAALQGALAECRVEGLALPGQQSAGAGAAGAQAPLGVLADCSRRLEGLKEKVRRDLLAAAGTAAEEGNGAAADTAPAAAAEGAPTVGSLRVAFGGLLLDAAEARRRYYELLRSTLAVSAHLEGLEQKVGTPVSSPTRNTKGGDASGPASLAGSRGGSQARLLPEPPAPAAAAANAGRDATAAGAVGAATGLAGTGAQGVDGLLGWGAPVAGTAAASEGGSSTQPWDASSGASLI